MRCCHVDDRFDARMARRRRAMLDFAAKRRCAMPYFIQIDARFPDPFAVRGGARLFVAILSARCHYPRFRDFSLRHAD